MDTMYAGRPGTPFIIKKSFKTVEEMQREFHDGDSSDVWFGEHCIIDTVNKNDRSNGSIYQRGPNWGKEDGDARYIGRIVGPASGTPSFSLTSLWSIPEWIKRTPVSSRVKHTYPLKNGDLHYDDGDSCSIGDEDVVEKLGVFSFGGDGPGLVPGKETSSTGETVYNDGIKYTWVNIAYPEDENHPTVTHVGLQIPYPVFDFSGAVKPPYDADGRRDDSVDFAGGPEEGHPFSYKYTLKVPSGTTGVSVKSIGIYKASEIKSDPDTFGVNESGKMYRLSDLSVDNEGGLTGTAKTYSLPSGDNVCDDPQIILVEMISFANSSSGDVVWAYVSDYDVLDDVHVGDDGTLVKERTYGASEKISKRVKWVDSFRLMEDGSVVVDYNTGERDNFMKFLKWVESLDVSDDGDLTIKFNVDHGERHFKLNWVKSISLSEDKDAGLLEDKRLKTTSVKEEETYIGSPINYILDVYVRPSDYHLMLLYNDKAHRGDPSAADNTAVDDDSFKDALGRTWVRKVHGIKDVLTDDMDAWDKVYWQDMGAVKDQSGLLVGGKITTSKDRADIIADLNRDYPAGRADKKIFTAGPDGDSQDFFAYDYDSNGWYYLGNLNKDGLDLAPAGTPEGQMKKTGYYVLTASAPEPRALSRFWSGWVTA